MLLLWGLAAALALVVHLDARMPPAGELALQGGRDARLTASIDVLARGGAPLLIADAPYSADLPVDKLHPANYADDPGIYLYVPLVAQTVGLDTPREVLRVAFIASMAVLMLLYPPLVGASLGTLAGFASPLVVLLSSRLLIDTDVYWMGAATALLALPLIILADRRRYGLVPALMLAAVLASVLQSLRSPMGLAVAAPIAVVVWRNRHALSARRSIAFAAALLAAFLAIQPTLLRAVELHRDAEVGSDAFAQGVAEAHPFWHPVYLGLGYLPNEYGIRWDDSEGLAAAQRIDPDVRYLGSGYGEILRKEYFSVWRESPGYAAEVYLRKLQVVFAHAVEKLGAVLLLPLAAIVLAPRRLGRDVPLIVPLMLLGLSAPLIGMPYTGYEVYFLVSLLLAVILSLTALETFARERLTGLGRRPSRRTGAQLSIACVAVAAACVATPGFLGAAKKTEALAIVASQASPVVPEAAFSGAQLVDQWNLRDGVPEAWEILADEASTADGMTRLQTAPGIGNYTLLGPELTLQPGDYAFVVDGVVTRGGLTVGLLDASTESWVQTRNFGAGQNFDAGSPAVYLSLDEATTVQPVLANWSPLAETSTWLVRGMRLLRLNQGVAVGPGA